MIKPPPSITLFTKTVESSSLVLELEVVEVCRLHVAGQHVLGGQLLLCLERVLRSHLKYNSVLSTLEVQPFLYPQMGVIQCVTQASDYLNTEIHGLSSPFICIASLTELSKQVSLYLPEAAKDAL